MNSRYQKSRRSFIKMFTSLGLLSILPIRIKAFSNIEDCITTSDIEGPFYAPNSPISILIPPEINSNFLFITGTVYANDCTTPIPNALVDVWHANKGEFDEKTNSYLNSNYEEDFYRAKIYTDNNGNYGYKTILPGKYLNGNYYRPSHIHYKSSYLDGSEITTQLYFEGDTSIDQDPWASNISSENRVISLETDDNNDLHGVFDITLDIDPSKIKDSIILNENQLIQAIYPNPINNKTIIYLRQTNQKISIEICNVSGQVLNRKDDITNHEMNIHEVIKSNMKKGIYIIRLLNKGGVIDAKRIIIP